MVGTPRCGVRGQRSAPSLPNPPRLKLPDVHPLIFGPHHRGAVRNIECLLELVEVRERSERPELARGMRICVQPQLQILIALGIPPDLRVTEEEPLLGCEPVDLRLGTFL